jgi:hypothetical protein
MRTLETRKKLFEAWKAGKNQTETSQCLLLPRETVRDYFKKFSTGEDPNRDRDTAQTRLDLSQCEFDSHLVYQYLYALGMYLGDGHITEIKKLKNGNSTYRMRVYQDSRYPEIIARIKTALSTINPHKKVATILHDGGSCTVVYTYSNDLVDLFPQHGLGKKHTRKIQLETWQDRMIEGNPKPFIKGLIESDGCRFINKVGKYRYPSYSFTNKSDDLHLVFSWACKLIGVQTTRSGKNTFVRKRANVEKLDKFIGPKV